MTRLLNDNPLNSLSRQAGNRRKKYLLLMAICCIHCMCFAHHIVGGEIYYVYKGENPSTHNSIYLVTLRLFRNCNAELNAAPLPTSVLLGVFINNPPYDRLPDLDVSRTGFSNSSLSTYPVCISFKPPVCYQVATYEKLVELPDNAYGYQIAFQTCCRADSRNILNNSESADGSPGATYVALIPGTNQLPSGHNSSAVFNLKDTALVCSEARFTLDFSATDADSQDSLSYAFVSSYDGGYITDASKQSPGKPPYGSLSYDATQKFSPTQPLGPKVSINHANGIISGVSPVAGSYAICVAVYEWRNGKMISSHRKDFILVVSNCKLPQANLNLNYANCDGFDLSFPFDDNSRLVHAYHWDFGVPGTDADTSDLALPSFTYPDTGAYQVTLIVNRGEQCTDTGYTTAIVFPGFSPKFGVYGNCIAEPYQFIDSSSSKYGSINHWLWTFDTAQSDPDGSLLQNPTYSYYEVGSKVVQFIVGSSKGCTDTLYKTIQINKLPYLEIITHDTLICSIDTLQLLAQTEVNAGGYDYSWGPLYNINNPAIPDPLVWPKTSTIYRASIDDHKGCAASDSVVVNVIDKVSLELGPDINICLGDSVQLISVTDGLHFVWTPAAGLSNALAKNPKAAPLSNITYSVLASVGHCTATDDVNISVVPYPQANAGTDTTLCYGFSTVLDGTMKGAYFNWSPTNDLYNAETLSPTASPVQTTAYVLTVTDTIGCPKPFRDTVIVNIIPKVPAFAGNDTSIVIGQPLQLNAVGGTSYVWNPSTGMNDPFVADPVIVLGNGFDSITYAVTVGVPEGCYGTDSITVKLFRTLPAIFVPNAFTPNGDGKNDQLRPILVGMKRLNYFRVFNRFGQIVFSSNQNGRGWDGNFQGKAQPIGTFVYEAEGIDYLGNKKFTKGTVTLIR